MATLNFPASLQGWEVMWAISFFLYGLLKVLSWWSFRRRSAPLSKHLAYLLAWPGMNAEAFLLKSLDHEVRKPEIGEWIFAASKLSSGVLLVFILMPLLKDASPLLIGWVGILGMIMCLHIGLFHVLSCWLRSCGMYAKPIMNWPILATGLSDFWGQRWNLAFRDLTHRFVFRPLARRFGMKTALLVGFALSGLVHDMVISVPAQGGYGLPTLFFCLQGIGISIEKSRFGRRIGLGKGFRGKCFAMLFLLLPIQWLFHRDFVLGIFYPFLRSLGATP